MRVGDFSATGMGNSFLEAILLEQVAFGVAPFGGSKIEGKRACNKMADTPL